MKAEITPQEWREPADRREYQRVRCAIPVRIVIVSRTCPVASTGLIIDISGGGLSLMAPRSLVGEHLMSVAFSLPGLHHPLVVDVVPIESIAQPHGRFVSRCQFIDMPPGERERVMSWVKAQLEPIWSELPESVPMGSATTS